MCLRQDGRVMMLEPVGEEDEADLLHHDDDANQSGRLLISRVTVLGIIFVFVLTEFSLVFNFTMFFK